MERLDDRVRLDHLENVVIQEKWVWMEVLDYVDYPDQRESLD